ncbi:hypothetical protein FOCC_FOCC002815 [Frankliniella occidentalis]|nr:hypothetical protein FOCC_FOCC002815 [Frankliniella occidentalis]
MRRNNGSTVAANGNYSGREVSRNNPDPPLWSRLLECLLEGFQEEEKCRLLLELLLVRIQKRWRHPREADYYTVHILEMIYRFSYTRDAVTYLFFCAVEQLTMSSKPILGLLCKKNLCRTTAKHVQSRVIGLFELAAAVFCDFESWMDLGRKIINVMGVDGLAAVITYSFLYNILFHSFLSLKMDLELSGWRCTDRMVFADTKVNDLRHGKRSLWLCRYCRAVDYIGHLFVTVRYGQFNERTFAKRCEAMFGSNHEPFFVLLQETDKLQIGIFLVRTLGYVGLGFSVDGKMKGADMVIGWVRDGQVFFQLGYCTLWKDCTLLMRVVHKFIEIRVLELELYRDAIPSSLLRKRAPIDHTSEKLTIT